MKRTLKSIFSMALMLVSVTTLSAQEKTKDTVKQVKTERYGIRVGLDLNRLAKNLYDSDYTGFEIVGDYRLTKKVYIAAEFGNEKKTVDEDQLNFTTDGSYVKLGFDYNTYGNWLDMENMIFVGMRFGGSTFSQQLNNYSIYNTNPYFGETTNYSGQKTEGLNASWLEVVTGVKAELFNNLYLGFSLRLNYLLTQTRPENFDNLFIPGFNRTYEGGNFGVGFNYSVSYFIPLYKSKK